MTRIVISRDDAVRTAQLRRRKRALEVSKNQTVKEWLDMSADFAEINSRANESFCLAQARKLEVNIDPDDQGGMS